MQLVGMLDSPYVRRVAISLQLLGLPFEHRSISVFRGFDAFQAINPVVKVPTLVCDDGLVLMDSTLILDHAESLAQPGLSLMPTDGAERRDALRLIGLALAACEKSVQLYYERVLRPAEKQHAPWATRVTGQMTHAFRLLDESIAPRPLVLASARLDQAALSAAVAWYFARQVVPDVLPLDAFPALRALSAQAETRPEFRRAPHSEAVYPQPIAPGP
jgi:glutathione S-transferase